MAQPSPGTTVGDRTSGGVNPNVIFSFVSTGLPIILRVGIGASAGHRANVSCTFGSGVQAFTQIGGYADDGNFEAVSIWYLANPTPQTGNITVTADGGNSQQIAANAEEWSNLGSIGTPVTAGSNTGNSIATSALTPSANDMVITMHASDNGGVAHTVDNGGSKIWEYTDVGPSTDSTMGASNYTGSGASVTPSWSGLNNSGAALIAVVLFGTGGGGGGGDLSALIGEPPCGSSALR